MQHEDLYTPNSIRTVSGRYVNLIAPDPATLDLGDIAWALAHVPRFGGHLKRPWSVAQHSMLVARMVPDDVVLQALLHDASEAFLCDVPSPLKQHLPEYKAIEERMMHAIATRFGIAWPMDAMVKDADKKALEMEWQMLMLGRAIPSAWINRIAELEAMSPAECASEFKVMCLEQMLLMATEPIAP